MSTADLAALLEHALGEALPESRDWERGWTRLPDGDSWWVATSSPMAPDGRTLLVELRPDGDVDVRLLIGPSGVGRGPHEAHWPVPQGRESEALQAVARFVADLVEEHLVLVYRRGWLGGGRGREFVEPAALTPDRRRHVQWVASWRATYD